VSVIHVAGAHAITTLVSGDARKFYAPAPLAQLNKQGFVKEVYPR
jgi:hypothetical protein